MKNDSFDIERHIDAQRALRIRELRVNHDNTWREVAYQTWIDWKGQCSWAEVPDHQLAGKDCCYFAARMLGENPYKEPWN